MVVKRTPAPAGSQDEAHWQTRLRKVAKDAKSEPQGEPRKTVKAKPKKSG